MNMKIHKSIPKSSESKCPECDIICEAHKLDAHLLTHKRELVYVCPICVYECTSKDDMDGHKLTHRKKQNVLENKNKCSECNYKFDSDHELKTHMLTHKREKLYACPLCVYECTSKDDMDRHMLTHTEEKKKNPSKIAQGANVWDNLNLDDMARKHFIDSFLNYDKDGFSAPFKNGKAMKFRDLQNTSTSDSKGGQRNPGIVGTAKGPALAITERKRQATLFATRYKPNVEVFTVKKDLEAKLKKLTGEYHLVDVERISTRYDSYASFKINCVCKNTDIFENAAIWPEGSLIRWWRNPRNGRGITSS